MFQEHPGVTKLRVKIFTNFPTLARLVLVAQESPYSRRISCRINAKSKTNPGTHSTFNFQKKVQVLLLYPYHLS